jgi:hypothetical protein
MPRQGDLLKDLGVCRALGEVHSQQVTEALPGGTTEGRFPLAGRNRINPPGWPGSVDRRDHTLRPLGAAIAVRDMPIFAERLAGKTALQPLASSPGHRII